MIQLSEVKVLSQHDDRLRQVAESYLRFSEDGHAVDGGFPMRLAEDETPTLLGTSYALAALKYGGRPADDEVVGRALRFLCDEVVRGTSDSVSDGWRKTRQAVHAILGLTEFPARLSPSEADDGPRGAKVADVHEAIDASLAWLMHHHDGGAWRITERGHVCLAWTPAVLYAVARLRERGFGAGLAMCGNADGVVLTENLETIERIALAAVLNAQRGEFWPECGDAERPSVANTALATIALSHRHLRIAPDKAEEISNTAKRGASWLVQHAQLWERVEHGEHDRWANDGWRHVNWSLALRGALSAGTPPDHPSLSRGLTFAHDRWDPRGGWRGDARDDVGGWEIRGDGVTGYSNWSVIQLGAALRLALSRQDPWRVLDALRSAPFQAGEGELPRLESLDAQRVALTRPRGERVVLELARYPKRKALLEVFIDVGARPQTAVEARDLLPRLERSAVETPTAWNAIKSLVYEVNQMVTAAAGERMRLLRTVRSPSGSHMVLILADCSPPEPSPPSGRSAMPDVAGDHVES